MLFACVVPLQRLQYCLWMRRVVEMCESCLLRDEIDILYYFNLQITPKLASTSVSILASRGAVLDIYAFRILVRRRA